MAAISFKYISLLRHEFIYYFLFLIYYSILINWTIFYFFLNGNLEPNLEILWKNDLMEFFNLTLKEREARMLEISVDTVKSEGWKYEGYQFLFWVFKDRLFKKIANLLADIFGCKSTLLYQSTKLKKTLVEIDKRGFSANFLVNSTKYWRITNKFYEWRSDSLDQSLEIQNPLQPKNIWTVIYNCNIK